VSESRLQIPTVKRRRKKTLKYGNLAEWRQFGIGKLRLADETSIAVKQAQAQNYCCFCELLGIKTIKKTVLHKKNQSNDFVNYMQKGNTRQCGWSCRATDDMTSRL
jgi:hypothetical protein